MRPHAHGSATAGRVDQAATIRQRSRRHCTWPTERKNRRRWRRRPVHNSFARLELQRCVRDIKVLFIGSLDKRIDQHMDQPSPGDTSSPSAGRERQESISLHTMSKEDVIGTRRKRRHLTPTSQSHKRASTPTTVYARSAQLRAQSSSSQKKLRADSLTRDQLYEKRTHNTTRHRAPCLPTACLRHHVH